MSRHLPPERLRPFLRDRYDAASLVALREFLKGPTAVTLTSDGFLQAATRGTAGADPTNYDAVWVRDAVWGALALPPAESLRVVRGLLAYFATEPQLRRLRDGIRTPELILAADGAMRAIHIRFDAKTVDDVVVAGQPQTWSHKQNDALGLFLIAVVGALADGSLKPDVLTDGEWEVVLRLPTYFDRLGFERMEDSGAWEEIEKISTSSISVVTAALERLSELLQEGRWAERFLGAAKKLRLNPEAESLFNGRLEALIDAGYERVLLQLPFESPEYPADSPKYREADAALMYLLYPAELRRLAPSHRIALIEALEPLVGDVGIKRYLGDAYQAGNYWRIGSAAALTDDCSAPEAFAARNAGMIPGTEAEWFFDSWLSVGCGRLYRETGEEEWLDRQTRHFNRALGQLTAPGVLGADGRPVPELAFPESYNTIVDEGGRHYAPSPITPLNWAKCSLRLALAELERNV